MKQKNHNEIYQVALDTATSELTEITAEFERLRLRKDQVERLILALRPIIGEDEETTVVETANPQPTPQLVEPKPAIPVEATPEPAGMVADPFQRRVDHVLGIGAGIRDVRQYTRQF